MFSHCGFINMLNIFLNFPAATKPHKNTCPFLQSDYWLYMSFAIGCQLIASCCFALLLNDFNGDGGDMCVFCVCWDVFKFLHWISHGIAAHRSFGDDPVRELVIKFGSHHWYASRNVHDPVPFAPIALSVPANMRISMHGSRAPLDIGWIAPGKQKKVNAKCE